MKLSLFTSVFGLSLFAAACARPGPQRPGADDAPVAVQVRSVHVESLPLLHRASGTVRGRNTAVLTSKTTGYVRAVRVRSGDRVTSGQPLLELEANDVRASVARARAALDQSTESKAEAESGLEAARAAAKLAKSSYERATKLLDDKAIPQAQFDEAEARFHLTQAEEHMAEARLRSLGSRIEESKAALGEANATLGYAVIVAPFSGQVLERRVDPGVLASPGTPLLVVADEGALRVEAAVAESRAADVRLGDVADVEIEGLTQPLIGKVGEIVPSVDVASRAFLVKIDLPSEASALRPGTFARVGFRAGMRPRLVVPSTSLTSLGALDRVFVVDSAQGEPRARLRMITHGETQEGWTEVLSGLLPDERVVVAPPPGLRDGAKVEVGL